MDQYSRLEEFFMESLKSRKQVDIFKKDVICMLVAVCVIMAGVLISIFCTG